MARRSKNPKLRDRMDPRIAGELGGRKDAIRQFALEVSKDKVLAQWIFEGFQWEMSPVQIRKALHKAVNIALKKVKRRK